MAKGKREEVEEKGDYEFKMPDFDETAFVRREVLSARASFYTIAVAVAAGVLSAGLYYALGAERWMYGWLPVLAAVLGLRPILQRAGFGEDVTTTKALLGSYTMLFFTALAVWIVGVNLF